MISFYSSLSILYWLSFSSPPNTDSSGSLSLTLGFEVTLVLAGFLLFIFSKRSFSTLISSSFPQILMNSSPSSQISWNFAPFLYTISRPSLKACSLSQARFSSLSFCSSWVMYLMMLCFSMFRFYSLKIRPVSICLIEFSRELLIAWYLLMLSSFSPKVCSLLWIMLFKIWFSSLSQVSSSPATG